MKNLAKLFTAVAALFAMSCTTDVTDDLSVQLGNGEGQTLLTLSLEESRTHLGEKADEVYPLYWSEGDVIAVNGVASNPLTAEAAGSAATTFEFAATLERPYCVVYPAPTEAPAEADGEESVTPTTVYPVSFLAEQPYTVGSFAPQAAPMYAYADAESGTIQLQHLTGVLRLAPKGNGEKISSITVSSEKGAIAGPFTIDCAKGTLIAQAEASNSVVVTFAEPLVLGAEAQPVYVTVPAGSYGRFAITLTTEAHGKMTVKFNSDNKAIVAGKVREFNEFIYAENTYDEVYLITTKEELIEFARIAPNFYPSKVAKLGASIDMTGYDWTPIEGFVDTFDGGNENAHIEGDNGIHIKGLNAPLFGTTSGTIQNLKLVNVNINETSERYVGAIARYTQSGAVKNCRAEGTLVMNSATTYDENATTYGFSIGGLVGRSVGTALYNCYNKVAVTLTSPCNPESATLISSYVGGIVGVALDATTLENCTNDAKILYNGTKTPAGKVLYLCGIVGYTDANNDTKLLKNLLNTENGDIEFPADAVCDGSLYMRGCIGVIYDGQTEVNNITNRGDITFLGTCNGAQIRVAGVGGNLGAGLNEGGAYKLYNYGNLNIGGSVPNASAVMRIGGIASEMAGDVVHKISDCHNYGAINVSIANLYEGHYIGGLFGNCGNGSIEMTNCVNEESGDIAINVTLKAPRIGGIIGYLDKKFTMTNCENKGDAIINVATTSNSHVAGFTGYNNAVVGTFENCVNSGTVKNDKGCGNNSFVGGFIGYATSSTSLRHWINCENKGVVYGGGNVPGSCRVGGFVGGTYAKLQFTSCTNSGAVTSCTTIKDDSDGKSLVAGFIGDNENANGKVTFVAADEAAGIKPCKNTGTITLTGTLNQYGRVSGIANLDKTDGTLTAYDVINEGQIVAKNLSGKGYIQVGGITACHIAKSKWINPINKGEILVENVTGSYAVIGGISGNTSSGSLYEGTLTNVGNISVRNCTFSDLASTKIGGIIGNAIFPIAGAIAYCNIEAKGYDNVGWFSGSARTDTVFATNCKIGGIVVEEWDNADYPPTPRGEQLTETNFFEHIYGGTTDWTGITNYDGCKCLESKPENL